MDTQEKNSTRERGTDMCTDEHLNKYADVLLWALQTARTGKFKKQDMILIQYDLAALRLAEILYERIVRAGMNPIQRAGLTTAMERAFYELSSRHQLTFIPPGEKELCEHLNGRIFLRAPDSLTHLKDIDPSRFGKVLVARKPLRTILDMREDSGLYSWTLCLLPTEELATHARISLAEYTDQLIKACYLDYPDPVSRWRDIRRDMGEIKKWLNSLNIKCIHVESSRVNLRITPGEKRKWVGLSGHNIPSFEIFTSPDWQGTEGTYYANLPSFRSGNYVEEVTLLFKRGRVVQIEAEKGQDFAIKQLDTDGGARRIGEFALTDTRFSRIDRFMADTLFDENHGGKFGSCHIALGASYTSTYDGNPATLTKEEKKGMGFNDSALHWDLINTEAKTVTAHLFTGKSVLLYENGMFTY